MGRIEVYRSGGTNPILDLPVDGVPALPRGSRIDISGVPYVIRDVEFEIRNLYTTWGLEDELVTKVYVGK